MTRPVQEADPPPLRPRRVTVRSVAAVLLVLVAVGVMVRLSLWQWDRARASGRFLNYTYAVEWLVFALLTLVGLARLVIEGRRLAEAPSPEERPQGPVIGPPLADGEELPEITWVRIRHRLGLDGGRSRATR